MANSNKAISQLFKASGHSDRIEILKTLNEHRLSVNDLSKLLDTSKQYVYKHFQILSEEGLIKRDEKGFTLSTSGKIFVNSFSAMEVITEYRQIWENHDLEGIPPYLLSDIGVLSHAELITPTHEVIDRITEVVYRSNELLLIAIDQPPKILMSTFLQKIEEGVKWHVVMRSIPPDLFIILSLLLLKYSGVGIKIHPKSEIYMGTCVVDNNEAVIIFADSQGFLDWNFGLYGTEPEFVSWVEKNFWEMYGKAEIYAPDKF